MILILSDEHVRWLYWLRDLQSGLKSSEEYIIGPPNGFADDHDISADKDQDQVKLYGKEQGLGWVARPVRGESASGLVSRPGSIANQNVPLMDPLNEDWDEESKVREGEDYASDGAANDNTKKPINMISCLRLYIPFNPYINPVFTILPGIAAGMRSQFSTPLPPTDFASRGLSAKTIPGFDGHGRINSELPFINKVNAMPASE
ncbi:hypothetical protein SADUNF_Sadunf02G0074000 [Salix dunnii]|uniref:Uncharacterized protein n=1 Tax=Salix dunnii TaxID=1413687 RepID=A0A835N6U9_9ROSI|nr:hypothetical protein SADUNF_Sadunf02G0074000 [Salix dunnii]